MATLMISLGTPMISGGDELGRTQRGNNNAYCQDNETSWLNWDLDDRQNNFLDFTRRVIQIRKDNPSLHRINFFDGIPGDDRQKDVAWLAPEGRELGESDWHDDALAAIGCILIEHNGDDGGDPLLVLVNPLEEKILFQLPETENGSHWKILLDTAEPEEDKSMRSAINKGPFNLPGRSLKIFRKLM